MHVLVTGAAGFIGYHTCLKLLSRGHNVTGLDNLNDYYPVAHKDDRLHLLRDYNNWSFVLGDIREKRLLREIFFQKGITHVVHLAAQAGVRYSELHPSLTYKNNIHGFHTLLEAITDIKSFPIQNLVYASSSSVYNGRPPFKESREVSPDNYYAFSKVENELTARLYKVPTTGLRFFSVYGEYARPDQVFYKFSSEMLQGKPVCFYNAGNIHRDFTHVSDIVNGILLALNKPRDHEIYNLGAGKAIKLMDAANLLASHLPIKQKYKYIIGAKNKEPVITEADYTKAKVFLGYQPKVDFKKGMKSFAEWFLEYQDKLFNKGA